MTISNQFQLLFTIFGVTELKQNKEQSDQNGVSKQLAGAQTPSGVRRTQRSSPPAGRVDPNQMGWPTRKN
jgi:hypothetical protein